MQIIQQYRDDINVSSAIPVDFETEFGNVVCGNLTSDTSAIYAENRILSKAMTVDLITHSILYRGGFTESVFAEKLLSNRAIFFKFWHSNLVVISNIFWNSCLKSNIQFWEMPKRGKSEFRDPEKGPKTPNKVEIVYNMAKIRWKKHIDPL